MVFFVILQLTYNFIIIILYTDYIQEKCEINFGILGNQKSSHYFACNWNLKTVFNFSKYSESVYTFPCIWPAFHYKLSGEEAVFSMKLNCLSCELIYLLWVLILFFNKYLYLEIQIIFSYLLCKFSCKCTGFQIHFRKNVCLKKKVAIIFFH